MPTWLELDQQFREVKPDLRLYGLDYQWGAAGVIYDVRGGGINDATRRFEALARIAGLKLQELPPDALHRDVMARGDPMERWYEALKHHSGAFEFGFVATQEDEGQLFTGSINSPATASGVLALRLSAVPIPPAAPAPTQVTGRWSRLNRWLAREHEERGRLWSVALAVATLLVAVLAVVLAG